MKVQTNAVVRAIRSKFVEDEEYHVYVCACVPNVTSFSSRVGSTLPFSFSTHFERFNPFHLLSAPVETRIYNYACKLNENFNCN